MIAIQPIVICYEAAMLLDINTLVSGIREAIEKSDKAAMKIILGPEFFFADYDNSVRKYTRLAPNDERWDLLEILKQMSKYALVVAGTVVDREARHAVNYAPIFLNFEEIKRVYKQGVGGNTEWEWHKPAPPININPNMHPDMFVVSNINFAVEICTDNGTIQNFLANRTMNYWPKIYMMPSYGMTMGDIFLYGQNHAAYARIVQGNLVWKKSSYDLDLDSQQLQSEIDLFALHQNQSGAIIQSDGLRCRVALKKPMSRKYRFITPTKSWPGSNETMTINQKKTYTSAVHLFPKLTF